VLNLNNATIHQLALQLRDEAQAIVAYTDGITWAGVDGKAKAIFAEIRNDKLGHVQKLIIALTEVLDQGGPIIGMYMDANDEERWVTLGNGSRVLLGEGGVIKAGLGGKFTGQKIGEAFGGKGGTQQGSQKNFVDGISIEAELQAKSNEVFDEFTGSEIRAISYYTRDGYRNINDHLRGKKDPSIYVQAEMEEKLQTIDSAIQLFQLEDDIIVHRGTSSNHYSGLSPGDIITHEFFVSTSIETSVARDFAGVTTGHMTEIRVPRGTPSLYIGANSSAINEWEFLLARGLQYRVVGQSSTQTILEVVS